MDQLVKEADVIKLYPKNFNRDTGFSLKSIWYLAISILQHSRKPKEQPVEERRSQGRGNKAMNDFAKE
jgi:hypothetical protein